MVATALRAARPELQQIAERAGVSRPTLYAYLAGRRTPGPDVLKRLAKALRMQSAELSGQAAMLESLADQDSP